MFIKRDSNGNISAVSATQESGFDEVVDAENPELRAFLNSIDGKASESSGEIKRLRASDAELARVLEDIINLLTDKGVIQFTELPEAAQQKLLQRKSLRRHIRHLDLVADDDSEQLLP